MRVALGGISVLFVALAAEQPASGPIRFEEVSAQAGIQFTHSFGAEKLGSLLESTGVVCDYVFLDPPYRMRGSYERTLGYLSQSRLLQPSTIVIAEHEKKFDPGERFGALLRYRRLDQGDASLGFYRLG